MEAVEESRQSINTQPGSEAGDGKSSSQETALLDALRGFVRYVNHQPEPSVQKGIGRLQAVVLLVFVLDAVLLYAEFQRWFENPIFQFALKVAPWLLGATAFTYSEKARAWLLQQCQRRWLAILAVVLLLPLVILRQPLFSVKVRVDSDSISAKSDDSRVVARRQEAGLFLVALPDLAKPYKIIIEDSHNDKDSKPFSLTLSRGRVARATFAQIPVVGRLFGSAELPLTPLYRVFTKSKTAAYVDIEGRFQEGFFQRDSLSSDCSPVKAKKGGYRAVRCNVTEGNDALTLPHGSYELTLFRDADRCNKSLQPIEVKEGENDPINFDQLCLH